MLAGQNKQFYDIILGSENMMKIEFLSYNKQSIKHDNNWHLVLLVAAQLECLLNFDAEIAQSLHYITFL